MISFGSIFSQLLQLFPKTEFFQAVKKTGAERRTKGFSCWGQFVSPCSFANSDAPIRSGKSPEASEVAKENCNTWESLLPAVPPWLMPISTAHGSFTKKSFPTCFSAVAAKCPARRNFVSKTPCAAWIPRPSTFR